MKNVDEWCAGGMRGQQDEEMSVQSMGEMGKDFFSYSEATSDILL